MWWLIRRVKSPNPININKRIVIVISRQNVLLSKFIGMYSGFNSSYFFWFLKRKKKFISEFDNQNHIYIHFWCVYLAQLETVKYALVWLYMCVCVEIDGRNFSSTCEKDFCELVWHFESQYSLSFVNFTSHVLF